MPISKLLRLLKSPFTVAGKVGRSMEMSVPNLFHPEQILSKSAPLKALYDYTVKGSRLSRIQTELFKKEARRIAKVYELGDPQRMDQFLQILEYPWYNKGAVPPPDMLAAADKKLISAVVDHLQTVTDPIHKLASAQKSTLGYVPGYFTHFPVKAYNEFLDDEIKRVQELMKGLKKEDPQLINLRAHLTTLNEAIDKSSNAERALRALRYRKLPSGARFGPLDEHRQMEKIWGYKKDYKDVMEEYIERAMRKIWLDEYLPVAKSFIAQEPNLALRQYAFDYVTAQRGALGAKRRIFLNESIAQLFPNPEAGYKGVAKAVDYTTRFQYLSKIGLSWFRFPFVNATQPLLTTYPLVGGKNLFLGYLQALYNPKLWREAKQVGVTFEASLRKGLTEALGRTPRLTKWERGISYPAQFSEQLNRVVSYAAGKLRGAELIKKGKLTAEQLVDYAINVVNKTQFIYHKEALPLIMSASPAGRLIFQFRTFTANYVNFMTQLIRNKQWPEFARAIGSLMVLAGSSAIPFNLWKSTREGLLRNAGVDIGDFNPLEWTSERFGISPPVNFGASLEPFNIPSDVASIFGPSAGPVIRLFTNLVTRPEESDRQLQYFFEGVAPPITRLVKGVTSPLAKTEPSKRYPTGRVLGRRGATEIMFMRPTTESTRREYVELMANAYAGGNPNLAIKLFLEGRRKGLRLGKEDLRQAKGRGTRLRGVRKEGWISRGIKEIKLGITPPPEIREIIPEEVR